MTILDFFSTEPTNGGVLMEELFLEVISDCLRDICVWGWFLQDDEPKRRRFLEIVFHRGCFWSSLILTFEATLPKLQ